jgi:hypothetical protein
MASTPEFRLAFVARLKQACDESSIIPPPHQGRQAVIATPMGIAPEAVSKWFKGVAMPNRERMVELAELLDVDESWLDRGVKPEMDRTQRRAHAREASGAADLVRGMAKLSGAAVAEPTKTDPRAGYVDFYCTLNGRMFAIHVSLGRETAQGEYEFLVPNEYADTRTIGVVLYQREYVFIDMPADLINEVKVRKAGEFLISVTRAEGGKYVSDSVQWPRVRSLAELR